MANTRKQGQRQRKSQSQKQRQSQRQRQSKSQRGGEEKPELPKPQHGGEEKPEQQEPQRGGEGENANMKISEQTMNQAKQIAEGLLQNLANGQKGGNAGAQVAAAAESTGQNGGEFSAYETTKGLQGAPISGGSRSQRQRQRQRAGSKSLQNKSQKQRGGMMPGVMTAFETALVPLGLYLSQKALQSRSGRGKSSSDKSFSSRFSRRRGRK